MCRLAAFPPGTSKEYAHEIVGDFLGCNDDGVGTAYLKGKSFVVNKFPYSYTQASREKKPLFDHMPHSGWTIAHVRLATHGQHTYANTHPIIRGDMAVVHNGIFSSHDLVRAALNKAVKWQGETDTEVGAYMLDQLGPQAFYKAMYSSSGVWMALHRDGSLSVTKLSGDLEYMAQKDGKVFLASSFPRSSKAYPMTAVAGVYNADAEGKPINFSATYFERAKQSNNSSSYHWRGGKLEKDDIHEPDDRTGTCQSSVAMARGGSYTPQHKTYVLPRPLTPSLWDWPDDERMLEYLKGI